jgi:hypothetical protein
MKSKEEILKKHILLGQSELDITKDNEFEGEDYKITEKYLCNAMQEYAMQFQEDMADKIKIIAKKVWEDIFNNETLFYNDFEDYYNDKLNKQD